MKKFAIIKNLAILDILLHGRKIILLEFIFSCIVGFTLGIYILIFSQGSLWGSIIGLLIFGIGFNYLPLFIYAFHFYYQKKEEKFYADLLSDKSKKTYIKLAFFLVVPYVVGMIAFSQEALDKTTII